MKDRRSTYSLAPNLFNVGALVADKYGRRKETEKKPNKAHHQQICKAWLVEAVDTILCSSVLVVVFVYERVAVKCFYAFLIDP